MLVVAHAPAPPIPLYPPSTHTPFLRAGDAVALSAMSGGGSLLRFPLFIVCARACLWNTHPPSPLLLCVISLCACTSARTTRGG